MKNVFKKRFEIKWKTEQGFEKRYGLKKWKIEKWSQKALQSHWDFEQLSPRKKETAETDNFKVATVHY